MNRTEELRMLIKDAKAFSSFKKSKIVFEAELKGRLEAIDEFVKELSDNCDGEGFVFHLKILQIAKQLKGEKD